MRSPDRASLIQALDETRAAQKTSREAWANYIDAMREYDAAVDGLVRAVQRIETHEAEKEVA